MIDFKLQQFSGPLDLLLNLIGEEKLDISEVSLSTVTEQYLEYLEKIEDKAPEELADFLLVAARLLLLKSKKLLPQFTPEESDGPSLEDQLRLYQAFVQASRKLNKLWVSEVKSFFRIEPPRRPTEFVPPENLGQENLHESLLKLLKRLQPLPELPQTRLEKTTSIKEKIEHIRSLLKKAEKISFTELLESGAGRSEIITSFLALLELVKQENIILTQNDNFTDITVERLKT